MISPEENPEFLNDFLAYSLTILNKSQNSVKEYNYDIAHFLKFIKFKYKLTNVTDEEFIKTIKINDFDIETLKRITLQDIHAFLQYLKTCYQSKPATLARKASTIRIFFKYMCNKTKRIPVNPAQDLENPKIGQRLPKYLSLEQSKELLETAASPNTNNRNHDNSERNFAMITLLLNCGLRLSELIGINISDIDFENEKLNVIGKGDKERTIYLNKACIKAIKSYLEVRPHDGVKFNSKDALFLSEQKQRISRRTVQYIVKEELKLARIEKAENYSVHKLRHTAATLMYKYGNVDIRALQELLGHESISTTQIYTHVDNEQIRNAVENNPLADL